MRKQKFMFLNLNEENLMKLGKVRLKNLLTNLIYKFQILCYNHEVGK